VGKGAPTPQFQDIAPCWSRSDILTQNLERFDLVYSNTVVNGALLRDLPIGRVPVVTHVHELETYLSQIDFPLLDSLTMHYVAASHAVARNLMNKRAVPESKISVIYENIVPVEDPEALRAERAARLNEFGIPSNSIVAGGCGTIDERKGADLFIETARTTLASHPEIAGRELHFLWIGVPHGEYSKQVPALLAEYGIASRVHFAGFREHPEYFCFDVFLLTSREDPFPLVMLEAAAQEVPVIGFSGSGGVDEFIEGPTGVLVPFLDTTRMSESLVTLFNDAALRTALGSAGRRRVLDNYSVSAIGPQIVQVITTHRNASHG
jgi:glycosyltransferase involved in cell wall biosynthesis